MTYEDILEQSFDIAWDVITKTGDLRDPEGSAIYLVDTIEGMMRSGERRRLLLSNLAIDSYRQRYHHQIRLVVMEPCAGLQASQGRQWVGHSPTSQR